MKRIIAILLAVLLIASLAACSGNKSSTPTKPEHTDGKTMIVYFSPSNADTADAVSSATPRVGDVSSVEYIAQLINNKVDADMATIVPKTAYPTDYDEAAEQAKQERDENVRPEFTLNVDPEEYDTIFIGYPIWWYELPMIIQTFFDTYDLSNKTIIPFNTHEGSGDGGTYDQIKELEPNATVIDGLAIRGGEAGDAESKVNEWLSGLGY